LSQRAIRKKLENHKIGTQQAIVLRGKFIDINGYVKKEEKS
jgi:hypothetical protein